MLRKHDLRAIRDNPAEFDRRLMRRDADFKGTAERLVKLDEDRRAAITAAETAQARRNAASKEIGEAKKSRDETRAQALMAEVAQLKASIPQLESEEKILSKELEGALALAPAVFGPSELACEPGPREVDGGRIRLRDVG